MIRHMRLLDRSLLRELLRPLIVCRGGFLVFRVAFDLLGDLDDLNQQRVTFAGVAELYWIRLPELLLTVLPFALLLALLFISFSFWIRNTREMVSRSIMRAAASSLPGHLPVWR